MRAIVFLVVVILLLQLVSAVSSTLKNNYSPRETAIGKFSQDVVSVSQGNAKILKDGHIEVGFNGEIKKIGNIYYFWFPAPNNAGNYSFVVENAIAYVNGVPSVVELESNFIVNGTT